MNENKFKKLLEDVYFHTCTHIMLFHLFLFLEVVFALLLSFSHYTIGDADMAKQGISPSFV
jgi:hypothetical protein